jgi:DNA repair protein RadC
MKIKGIKKAKAVEIMGIVELSKRISKENNRCVLIVHDAEAAYSIVKNELENETQEHFLVLFLNIKLELIKTNIYM